VIYGIREVIGVRDGDRIWVVVGMSCGAGEFFFKKKNGKGM
jgi:hypothetical protein